MNAIRTVRPKILVVDDEPFNVDYLEQELEDLEYTVLVANDGLQALQVVASDPPDMILLDIMMPFMNGFEVLQRLKDDPATSHIPVVVISAHSDMKSVARGIQLGADDYLSKPVDPVLLQARLSSGLERKYLRDLELEYLEQVGHIAAAAEAVENNRFRSESLDRVGERDDALGRLARVFQHMAGEVHAREQRLKRQIEQLRQDIDEQQRSAGETAALYLPMDRRYAFANGLQLAEQARGAALAADISGFSALTAALAAELGRQRGAEELLHHLNLVFGALIDEVHRYGGSVITFSGDAITCWFDDALPPVSPAAPPGLRALACAQAMQIAIQRFSAVSTAGGARVAFAIKVIVSSGSLRRFLVGDPAIQSIETLAGQILEHLSAGDHLAKRGQILVHESTVSQFPGRLAIDGWLTDRYTGQRFAVFQALSDSPPPTPWPLLDPHVPSTAQSRPWLLPAVFERVQSGQSAYLAELRPSAALMLHFGGLDYENDPHAGIKLDGFILWVQAIASRHAGSLIQLTIGDKGSYVYLCFGAPVTHSEDASRAAAAALDLLALPAELDFIDGLQIGLAYGSMRSGAYGSAARRTYGVLGEKTNLAARLMQIAAGGILCDQAIYEAARSRFDFTILSPVSLKGYPEPVEVYRLLGEKKPLLEIVDTLPPELQLTIKVASVIGQVVPFDLLQYIYPIESDRPFLGEYLERIETLGLLALFVPDELPASARVEAAWPGSSYIFCDIATQEAIYNLLLFSQRRGLHRAIAAWYEETYIADLSSYYLVLAHHWQRAEDSARAANYLEKAGELGQRSGSYSEAMHYFGQALALDAGPSPSLSEDWSV